MNYPKETTLKYFLHLSQKENTEAASKSFKLVFRLNPGESGWRLIPHVYYIKRDGSFGRELEGDTGFMDRKDLNISGEEILAVHHLAANEKKYPEDFPYGISMGYLFSLLKKSLIFSDSDLKHKISFYPESVEIFSEVIEYKDAYRIQYRIAGENKFSDIIQAGFNILTEDPLFLIKNNVIYEVKNQIPAYYIEPFLKENYNITIGKKDFVHYFRMLYPRIASATRIKMPDAMPQVTLEDVEKKRLYLFEKEGKLHVQLKFVYGDAGIEVDGLNISKIDLHVEGNTFYAIKRQDKVEKLWSSLLDQDVLLRYGSYYELDSTVNPLEWLYNQIPRLAARGFEILGQEKLGRYRLRRGQPVIRSYVSEGLNWFDVEIKIEIDGLELDSANIQRIVRSKSRFVRLADGSYFRLDDHIMEKLGFLKKISRRSAQKVKFEVSKYHVNILNEVLSFSNQVKMGKRLKTLIGQLDDSKSINPQEANSLFKGTLRPYQKNGLGWLLFLNKYQFGGCLADDMGLGKTVQALALLQKNKGRKSKPNLIIAPTSVLYNWQREIERFTPNLTLLVYSGKDRRRSRRALKTFDIILTTYTLLWRERELFTSIDFYYAILDESQKIKNPYSLTARCAREIQARHRLVMTGTPIENNTIEMWSQFEFVNPGMLGSINSFRENFAYPIERHGDKEKSLQLKKLIFPFLLRRTKDEVAKELPPKIEHTVYCNMVEEQAKYYARWHSYYRDNIFKEISIKGLNRSRFYILEGLNKLRQISIHPKMIDPAFKGSSGKYEHLIDTIEDITAEDHKVLIYSQFVKMLHIIRDYLSGEQIPFAYLDGKTINRAAQVDLFQKDPAVKIFLISLKAGGIGLNLTAADYVIHIDPWWNPAVEIQATDRAHRIGQDKKVFVYRLISLGTIEEKIIELQKRKKRLVEQILPDDKDSIKSINLNDLKALFDII
jgi:non-specific serine/threonine protein kinase